MASVTYDDLEAHFGLLKESPEKFLELANKFVKNHSEHAGGYFSRHFAWAKLGQMQRALEDIETSLRLEPHGATYRAKGKLLHQMGRYQKAIDALNQAKDIDPAMWRDAFGPLYRADCYARLGNEAAALADCMLLVDDHFLPHGLSGTPRGNKQQVIEEIRRRAAAARQKPPV